jgi:hypothetical protein
MHTPSGLPSSGSKSNDDSSLEMWYMAPTPTHQQETIMLESLLLDKEQADAWSPATPSHVDRLCHDTYIFNYFISSLITRYRHSYLD